MNSQERQRKWIHRADRWVAYLIRFSGIVIILSVVAILFFISLEAYPLVKRAVYETLLRKQVPSDNRVSQQPALPLDIGLDEQSEVAYLVSHGGTVEFLSLPDGPFLGRRALKALENTSLTASYHTAGDDTVMLGTADGRVALIEVNFRAQFEDGKRRITYRISEEGVWPLSEDGDGIRKLVGRRNEYYQIATAAMTETQRVLFLWVDPEYDTEVRHDLTGELDAPASAFALTASGETLIIGTERGSVYHWDMSDPEAPELMQAFRVTTNVNTPVTSLEFLIGGESLVVGDAEGNIGVHFRVRTTGAEGRLRFERIRRFEARAGAITHIVPSPRDKGFLVADDTGEIRLYFSTSERMLLRYQEHTAPIHALAFAPKADGVLSLDDSGMLRFWSIENPHPEVSLKTLFGQVWYENYPEPEFVWQTTGAMETESKFSLMPLIFGTLKATLYAMIFSVPLALLGAFYTSQFAPSRVRDVVKPTVELMASIPSVVIGFLAGLWLAPLLERLLLTSFLMLLITPITLLLGVLLWQLIPHERRNRLPGSTELGLVALLVFASVLLSHTLSGPIESAFFGGNLKSWLFQTWGVDYDNRNALVVGFALGFAVIPIIYTIAEDALANVPQSLVSAALALGASKTQAALKVVLPAASPGIFAAIMLGLGRAVGETMIVLMASGNAPILDWSPFNGMRTMSAAIAIEIPEAPRGETLYRVLFLVAALLFVFTFLINTISNLVSTYLRKKYSRF